MIRVVLADDRLVVRAGLRLLLAIPFTFLSCTLALIVLPLALRAYRKG